MRFWIALMSAKNRKVLDQNIVKNVIKNQEKSKKCAEK